MFATPVLGEVVLGEVVLREVVLGDVVSSGVGSAGAVSIASVANGVPWPGNDLLGDDVPRDEPLGVPRSGGRSGPQARRARDLPSESRTAELSARRAWAQHPQQCPK